MELISREGYRKLCEKINSIDDEIISVRKAMGESAKRDNDLRENPEYMELRVKAMYSLPQEKQNLIERSKNCRIIEETEEYKNFDGTVIVGCVVKIIWDGDETDTEIFTILGDCEGDLSNNVMSYKAPFAQAFLGKHVNDIFSFNGMMLEIKEVKRI